MQLEANGKLMKLQTTDGHFVVVTVTEPLTGPVEPGSHVYLHAFVESRNKLKPLKLRILKGSMCESFDTGMWNELVAILIENPDIVYDDFSDSLTHFGVSEVSSDGTNVDLIPIGRSAETEGGDNKNGGPSHDSFSGLDEVF